MITATLVFGSFIFCVPYTARAEEYSVKTKADFFQKLIAFFKKIFGLTKVIPEAIEIFNKKQSPQIHSDLG